jgi:uncharacterized protein (UPF0333 family)
VVEVAGDVVPGLVVLVVGGVVLPGDLHAAGNVAIATPAAATTACFKNWRLVKVLIRKMFFFRGVCFPSFSGMIFLLFYPHHNQFNFENSSVKQPLRL